MSVARTLITVAPTGAESLKSDVPALPVTLAELVDTAIACEAAGAGWSTYTSATTRLARRSTSAGCATP